MSIDGQNLPFFIGEFWTARQRQASRLHEISYRACFKPQLPAFFIERLSKPGDLVYDPFSGRGTTAIEAGRRRRRVAANDINPLSVLLTRPRFFPPRTREVTARLEAIPFDEKLRADIDLSMFYHPRTEGQIVSLREYLATCSGDQVDAWIRLVATNRLTGHSPGFFSVYTLPPNQATSSDRQIKINRKRGQAPPLREVPALIIKKSRALVADLDDDQLASLATAGERALFLTGDARHTDRIPDNSVQLTVTSPPFLDVVQYSQDNWLRCWFNGLDDQAVARGLTMARTVSNWSQVMAGVFAELYRVTRPGGWLCFEVGEVRSGQIRLEEVVIPLGIKAGFVCGGVLINSQKFTKTANIWGVDNNDRGTNTNRVVLFRKD